MPAPSPLLHALGAVTAWGRQPLSVEPWPQGGCPSLGSALPSLLRPEANSQRKRHLVSQCSDPAQRSPLCLPAFLGEQPSPQARSPRRCCGDASRPRARRPGPRHRLGEDREEAEPPEGCEAPAQPGSRAALLSHFLCLGLNTAGQSLLRGGPACLHCERVEPTRIIPLLPSSVM